MANKLSRSVGHSCEMLVALSELTDPEGMAAMDDDQADVTNADRDAPTGGDAHSKTVQVLLDVEELEELERVAAHRGSATSGVARGAATRSSASSSSTSSSTCTVLLWASPPVGASRSALVASAWSSSIAAMPSGSVSSDNATSISQECPTERDNLLAMRDL